MRTSLSFIGLILVLFLIVQPAPIFAQSLADSPPADNKQKVKSESIIDEFDTENRDKLTKMSREEVELLDKRLEEALIFYNEGKFQRALPIFKEISDKVESIRVLWWIGTSAKKTGDNQLAIEKFKKILSINPKLQRVRLELALAYFESGNFEESKKEFEIVKAGNPPDAVRQNIDRFLAAINENTKKVFWNVRLSEGFMWDDNVNGGPTNRDLAVAGGTLTLNNESVRTSDRASVTNLSGNVLYDIGDRNGFMWNTTADLYYKSYFEFHKYNFGMIDLTTGPWWVGNKFIVKIPVGYSDRLYGSDRLSYSKHIDPSFEFFFNQYVSIKAAYSFSNDRYYSETYYYFDNNTKVYQIAPSFYFLNRQHIITLNADYETSVAESKSYSYTGPRYGISYYAKFPTKTELFLKYQWMQRDYKDIPFFLYEEERVDRRYMFTAALSQEFLKDLFISYAFTYTRNDSNASLYEFRQTTHTVSVGCKF